MASSYAPQLTAIRLKHRRPQFVPGLNEQRKNEPNPAHKHPRPHIRHRQIVVIHIHQVIHYPTGQIPATQRIQPLGIQPRVIPCYDGGREKPDVLESILLRPFGARDAVLGGGVEGAVFGDGSGGGARLGGVVLFGGGALVEGDGVEVGDDGEDPGGRDGVEGEVAGSVEEGGHDWLRSGGLVGGLVYGDCGGVWCGWSINCDRLDEMGELCQRMLVLPSMGFCLPWSE